MENFFFRVFIQTDAPPPTARRGVAPLFAAALAAAIRGNVSDKCPGRYGSKDEKMRNPHHRAAAQGVCEVPKKGASMRATRLIILGAASHVCCGQSLYHRDFDKISPPGNGNGRHVRSRPQAERREAPRSWFVSGGGAAAAADEESHTRWWRSRKRWAKRQAEKKAAEERVASTTGARCRKHVIAVQGMLRRLKRWLGLIVDITTLKRLRLLRQARQVRRRLGAYVLYTPCSQSLVSIYTACSACSSPPGSTQRSSHVSSYGIRACLGWLRLSQQKIQETLICLPVSANAGVITTHHRSLLLSILLHGSTQNTASTSSLHCHGPPLVVVDGIS